MSLHEGDFFAVPRSNPYYARFPFSNCFLSTFIRRPFIKITEETPKSIAFWLPGGRSFAVTVGFCGRGTCLGTLRWFVCGLFGFWASELWEVGASSTCGLRVLVCRPVGECSQGVWRLPIMEAIGQIPEMQTWTEAKNGEACPPRAVAACGQHRQSASWIYRCSSIALVVS